MAVQTVRRGRKTAITLAFDTQSSRADAITPRIVELVKINACFAVKAWRSNGGFLGDCSFQAGIRATELRPGKDVGTSIVTGATPERFEIVKWFYIDADDDTGYDAATDVITRAMTYLDKSAPGADIATLAPAPAARDLLDDLAQVLGNERVPTADVPARLRDLAADYEPSRSMTGVKLRETLERKYGVKIPSTGNRYPIDPRKVRARIAARAAAIDVDHRSSERDEVVAYRSLRATARRQRRHRDTPNFGHFWLVTGGVLWWPSRGEGTNCGSRASLCAVPASTGW